MSAFVSRRIVTLPAYTERAICTLGGGQQHRTKTVVVVAVAIVVVRVEQSSVGAIVCVAATLEPTIVRICKLELSSPQDWLLLETDTEWGQTLLRLTSTLLYRIGGRD